MRTEPLTEAEIKEANKVVKLSILICTTKDRRILFNTLYNEFRRQIEVGGFIGKGIEKWEKLGTQCIDEDMGTPIFASASGQFNHPNIVELLFEEDEKQISVGAKRQKLLERSKGKYIVYFDSDDFPSPNYVSDIIEQLEKEPDCIGFKIEMTTNNENPQTCCHSLKYKSWANNIDGFDYVRNVSHFNPVKKELALQVGFKDLRFGEDKDYSDRVTLLCKHEIFIDKFLFKYRYSNIESHNLKYGIK